ncbi:MAG: hypothetical protein ABIJ91_01655 [Candidatus Kuenenbacteria bacterium]
MKKIISLDFIIIFTFGFLFLLNWDKTNVGNFILFFVLLAVYLCIDKLLNQEITDDKRNKFFRYKTILLFAIIFYLLTITLVVHIGERADNSALAVHDSIEQVESAIKFVLAGKNPYSENYFGTELERSGYVMTTKGAIFLNPALLHCVYLPWQFIISVPFYWFFSHFFNFYDQRIVYLVFFILSLFALFALPKKKENKFILVALYALNPLFLIYFIAGRSDVFVLSFIIFTVYFLSKNKFLLASAMLALACASKHSAWFLAPVYYFYLFFKIKSELGWRPKIKILWRLTWVLPVIFLIIITPFVLWNPTAFWQDIYLYPAGKLATSYPINGFGVANWLYELGLIRHYTDYIPLWPIQIPLIALVLSLTLYGQRENNTLSRMVFSFACLIFVFWLFSRFFHDNYVGFVSQLFLIAYFLDSDIMIKT